MMRLLRLTNPLLALLCTVCAVAQTAAPDGAAPFVEDRARDGRVARMKTDDRIAYFQKAASLKAGNAHYKVLLAGAYVQKMRETTDFGYIERASTLVNAVLAADPQNYDARRLRTEIQLEYHQFQKAVESSRELIRMHPSDPWNWGTLGDALIEMGDYEQGADAFQKMADLRPDLFSYNRAAHYRFLTNDPNGAVEIMQLAIRAGSSSPENVAWCLVELGNIHFKTGRLNEAGEAYRSALRYFSGSHAAYAGLGKVYAAEGKLTDAVASYEHAKSITPLPDYAAALSGLYSLLGRKAEAAKQMQLVDVIYKLMRANNEKINRNLSVIYSDHDRNLEVALELAQAELDFRKDIYTYDALGWALYKNKKYEDAEKAAAKAMLLETPEPAFYYHAGMIASALGKREDAQKFLNRAMTLNAKFDLLQSKMAGELLAAQAIVH